MDNDGLQTVFSFAEPINVTSDGQARIVLANSVNADDPTEVSMTVDLPAPLTYYPGPDAVPQEPGFEEWYP